MTYSGSHKIWIEVIIIILLWNSKTENMNIYIFLISPPSNKSRGPPEGGIEDQNTVSITIKYTVEFPWLKLFSSFRGATYSNSLHCFTWLFKLMLDTKFSVSSMHDLATKQERQLTTACINQTTDLTNDRAANWAPEVMFTPFCALSPPQLAFPFCC